MLMLCGADGRATAGRAWHNAWPYSKGEKINEPRGSQEAWALAACSHRCQLPHLSGVVTTAMSFCARSWAWSWAWQDTKAQLGKSKGTTGGGDSLQRNAAGPYLGSKPTHLHRVPLHAFCLAERNFKPAEMTLTMCDWRNGR